jgi:hypothetical protein
LKYRPKPVTTNAWQFTGTNWDEIRWVVGSHYVDVDAERHNFIPVEEQWVDIPEGIIALVWVAPSHQWAGVKTGDYIVEDSEGDFYPCDRQIFEKKYEPYGGSGVITSDNVALKQIQQSRRFQ